MQKNDISPLVALALLLLVLLTLFGLNNYEFITLNWALIEKAFEQTQNFLLLAAFSLMTNVLMATLFVERLLGYKKQGSRLRSIKKQRRDGKSIFLKALLSLSLSGLFWVQIDWYTLQGLLPFSGFIPEMYLEYTAWILSGSFVFSLSIAMYGIISVFLALKKFFKLDSTLPRKSRFKDCLTLGAVGEEPDSFDKVENPKWVSIPRKALNGNILVTGSIGTGKTQGTILNFVDQLFNQFSPTPAALVLDPKGSFIEKVVKILDERGLNDKCIYLGDVHANV